MLRGKLATSRRNQGFTLMEMLIVVAIIAALIAVAIPIFSGIMDRSKEATDLANERSAYAAARAQYMVDGTGSDASYYFDGSRAVTSSSGISGYGQSSRDASEFSDDLPATVSGVPNVNGAGRFLKIDIAADGTASMSWTTGGNDLTTASGRHNEDVDNMESIASALTSAYTAGNLPFIKNFIQVNVYGDGSGKTVAKSIYVDGMGTTTDEKYTSVLTNAGIDWDNLQVHSTDDTWKYGYTLFIEKDGSVQYQARRKGDSPNNASSYWYKPTLISEEERSHQD